MRIAGTVEILGGIAIGAAAQAGPVAVGAAMVMLAFLAVGDLAAMAIDK
jgi:hypothetical protein